jgi:hypothetical protein
MVRERMSGKFTIWTGLNSDSADPIRRSASGVVIGGRYRPRAEVRQLADFGLSNWVSRYSKRTKRPMLRCSAGRYTSHDVPSVPQLGSIHGSSADAGDGHVLVRSDGEAVAINLDIEPAEPPEDVPWVDPTHPG